MPDKRSHRGPHPEDDRLFTAKTLPVLTHSVADMSWLLSRGYADRSTLKLVGDRYNLTKRQRLAIMRCSCSDAQLNLRQAHQTPPEALIGHPLILDGYNILITIEAALGDGVLFIARDGCIRDLASIHGTYRKVAETQPAIETIGNALKSLQVDNVIWFLDKPVSNSGRLRALILNYAEENRLKWTVELVQNPDKSLINSSHIVATSDSIILEHCERWFNLARFIINTFDNRTDLNLFDLASVSASKPNASL